MTTGYTSTVSNAIVSATETYTGSNWERKLYLRQVERGIEQMDLEELMTLKKTIQRRINSLSASDPDRNKKMTTGK